MASKNAVASVKRRLESEEMRRSEPTGRAPTFGSATVFCAAVTLPPSSPG